MVEFASAERILVFVMIGLCSCMIPSKSYAGWFGSSQDDYDQCVLEKMKGESGYLLGYAADACRHEFPLPEAPPAPKTLENIADIDYKMCGEDENKELEICIIRVSDEYTLEKVEAAFFSPPCNVTIYQSDFEKMTRYTAEKSWFRSKYTFDFGIPPNFCVVFSFYGFRR